MDVPNVNVRLRSKPGVDGAGDDWAGGSSGAVGALIMLNDRDGRVESVFEGTTDGDDRDLGVVD